MDMYNTRIKSRWIFLENSCVMAAVKMRKPRLGKGTMNTNMIGEKARDRSVWKFDEK